MQHSPSSSSQTIAFPIPPKVLLSLATAPLLVGLVLGKAVSELIQQTGQWSEELFRGDRLPLLDLDSQPSDDMIR